MLDIIARARITKVDAKQRLVYGRATQEVVDKSNEIFDYDRSKPHFEKWSQDAATATKAAGQEESLGNVRAMHKDVAAGKLTAIDFNDAEKAIDVVAFIADDAEWAKVEKGVYTGFSIGGKYADRWADPANPAVKRFEAIPAEISIVDNPCVPTATFEMIKADGATELRKFASTEETAAEAPASDATASDAATAAESAPAPVAKRTLTKSMWDVADFASMLSSLRSIAMSAEWEKEWEQDDSPIPAKLRAWLKDGAALFQAMAAEEVAELVASAEPPEVAVLAAAAKDDLAKAKSAAQSIHDHSVAMGASCSSKKSESSDDLAKIAGERDTLAKQVSDLTAERDSLAKRADDLAKRVAQLEAEPAEPKGATKVVAIAKTADTGDAGASETVELPADPTSPEFAKAVMKIVHARGAKPLASL